MKFVCCFKGKADKNLSYQAYKRDLKNCGFCYRKCTDLRAFFCKLV